MNEFLVELRGNLTRSASRKGQPSRVLSQPSYSPTNVLLEQENNVTSRTVVVKGKDGQFYATKQALSRSPDPSVNPVVAYIRRMSQAVRQACLCRLPHGKDDG